MIHVSKVDLFVIEGTDDYGVYPEGKISEDFNKIWPFSAEKIYDRDTLQIGVGNLAMQLPSNWLIKKLASVYGNVG